MKDRYTGMYNVGDILRSLKNPRLTYNILETGHINERDKEEYKVEIFADGKAEEPRNIKYIVCEEMDKWAIKNTNSIEENVLKAIMKIANRKDYSDAKEWATRNQAVYNIATEAVTMAINDANNDIEKTLAKYGLTPYEDGNQWCILLGKDIQEGICGFGDTRPQAFIEFLSELINEVATQRAPQEETKQEPSTRQLWDEYTIELTDCDNGIFCKVHDFNPDAEDAFLVYKREEQEQMFGKFLLDSIRAKMNCDLCSKARIDIKITTIED